MSFKNHWMISSSYNFQAHLQHSQRRCCFSQTALQWFEVLPDLSPATPDLSPALPGLSPALPGAPKLVIGAPRLVAGNPSYSEGRQECPPRVWYSPEIDASKFILHILSDTPGAFQWLKYILLMSSVSPNINENHGRCHLCTLHAPDAPCEVYFSTRVLLSACSSTVHSRSSRCAFSFGIWTRGFPFPSFNYDHLLIVQGIAIWIIRCATFCWASWFSVRMACIKLFTAEYNTSALYISITVSSSKSSGTPENNHIAW